MTDLLERLAAANPVPEAERPPIEVFWRKIAELEAAPRRRRGDRWGRLAGRIGRAVPTAIAVAVPIIVVALIADPLLGTHQRIVRPTSTEPRAGHGHGRSTLDPSAQRVAARQLAGRPGAVVVLDPRTGAIKVMYGNATHDVYSPGATFEIVTAAAALDSGRYTANSLITGRSPLTVSGAPIRNFANQSFGQIRLTQARKSPAKPGHPPEAPPDRRDQTSGSSASRQPIIQPSRSRSHSRMLRASGVQRQRRSRPG